LRELLGSLPAAVAYVAGPDLVFEFASDGYRRVLGGRDVIGRPFREAVPEVVGRPRFEALRQVLRTGEPRQFRGEEAWLARPGAEPEPRYIDSSYQPVRDEAGQVAGVLIFAADVSDHVRDRQQLEEVAGCLHPGTASPASLPAVGAKLAPDATCLSALASPFPVWALGRR
jgi:PAS domain-containing protein